MGPLCQHCEFELNKHKIASVSPILQQSSIKPALNLATPGSFELQAATDIIAFKMSRKEMSSINYLAKSEWRKQ